VSCVCVVVAVDPDQSSCAGEGGTQVHRHFEQVRPWTLPDARGEAPVHGTFTPPQLCHRCQVRTLLALFLAWTLWI